MQAEKSGSRRPRLKGEGQGREEKGKEEETDLELYHQWPSPTPLGQRAVDSISGLIMDGVPTSHYSHLFALLAGDQPWNSG